MRPLERPRTVSPDVSRFISAPDPEELIEVPDVDETPYVLHVPIKPPPPARFANRRKLYDDTAAQDEPDFGDGVVQAAADESLLSDVLPDSIVPEAGDDGTAAASDKTSGDTARSRRRRRGRGGDPDAVRPSGHQASQPGNNAFPSEKRSDRGERPGGGQQSSTSPAGRANRHTNPRPDKPDSSTNEANVEDIPAADSASSEPSSPEHGDGRRRSRRRGRRRGPRPEGGGA